MLNQINEPSAEIEVGIKRSKLENVIEHLLDFEKLRYCNGCGICTATCPIAKLLPGKYNPRVLLHSLSSGNDKILKSPELWLCGWCYNCYRRCPQNLNLPEIFYVVRKFAVEFGFLEGFYKALEIIKTSIPLPLSCSNICFHPDRVIKNKKLVIEAFQKAILTSNKEGYKERSPLLVNNKKVAIIGSGPAGLSAANYLAKKGYSVTIFEALSSSGGMLRRCIPNYRLPNKLVDFDIMFITDLGVEIKTNTPIGGILKLKKLFEDGYDAIFIATGAHEDKKYNIKGQELQGVYNALDFLESANKKDVKLLNKVTVIGGGNVAIDSARTALRLGAKEVTILYRRSKEEIPASPWEIREAQKEGVKIDYLVTPKKILGEDGKVTAVECIKNELGDQDKTGRRRPIPIKGSEFTIPTDGVIIAIGQFPNTVFLPNTVDVTKQRTIETNPFTLETSSPSIFAGGDVVLGSGTLIETILAGKQAAYSIDCYLRGDTLDPLEIVENTFGNENGGY
ncbi:FAD-dependent oxidoreductase [Candidatus Bathyarchaeota archaeon]|nr:FAD-dependent oxidoreductase [Candidatus Bathyarchaeota archaeon]